MSWSGKSELPFLKSWEFFQKGSFLSEGGGFCCCCSSVKKCLVRGENNWANGNTHTLATFVVSFIEKKWSPTKHHNFHSNKALNHFIQNDNSLPNTDRQTKLFFIHQKCIFKKCNKWFCYPLPSFNHAKKVSQLNFEKWQIQSSWKTMHTGFEDALACEMFQQTAKLKVCMHKNRYLVAY